MVLINMLHPNIIFANLKWKFSSYNSLIEENVTYTVNDILTVFSALRVIPLFIYIFKTVKFNSDKATRIW